MSAVLGQTHKYSSEITQGGACTRTAQAENLKAFSTAAAPALEFTGNSRNRNTAATWLLHFWCSDMLF
jgi:hypothetical protein